MKRAAITGNTAPPTTQKMNPPRRNPIGLSTKLSVTNVPLNFKSPDKACVEITQHITEKGK